MVVITLLRIFLDDMHRKWELVTDRELSLNIESDFIKMPGSLIGQLKKKLSCIIVWLIQKETVLYHSMVIYHDHFIVYFRGRCSCCLLPEGRLKRLYKNIRLRVLNVVDTNAFEWAILILITASSITLCFEVT